MDDAKENSVIDESLLISLIRSEGVDGNHYFFYLAAKAIKLKQLREDTAKGDVNLAEYGMILAFGQGEPDEEVKERITREYGFNHEKIIDLKW